MNGEPGVNRDDESRANNEGQCRSGVGDENIRTCQILSGL